MATGPSCALPEDGTVVAGPAVPFALGYAQLAFAGGTAVMAVQKAGSLTSPVDYAWDAGGTWTALRPLAGTWSVGYAPGLTQTAGRLAPGHGHRQRLLPAGGFRAGRATVLPGPRPSVTPATALPTAPKPAATRAGA